MKDYKKKSFITPPFISEAVCAELLQKVNFDNIQTSQAGSFKKSFSNDIEKFELEEYGGIAGFKITLNRNGIYDLLPEGLFHQTLGGKRIRTANDAVAEHKRYKEEEKNVRKFFAPLEQMLFRYKVYTEVAETEALYDIQNGKLNSSFYTFWGIDLTLPEAERNRMLRMMPYCNFIKGNKEATLLALRYILNKEITVEQFSRGNSVSLLEAKPIAQTRLGMNTVLGKEAKEQFQFWVFTIENVPAKDLSNYVEGGGLNKLLTRFTEIFIPLEIDAEYEIKGLGQRDEQEVENILGYGSYL